MSKKQISVTFDKGILARVDQMEGNRNTNMEMLISSALAEIDSRGEAKKKKPLTVRFDEELYGAISKLASGASRSLQAQVIALIEKAVKIEAQEVHQTVLEQQYQRLLLQNEVNTELIVSVLAMNDIPISEIEAQKIRAEKAAIKKLEVTDD